MKELLDHPWLKVLLIATTIAMCSFALRETASITQPVVIALGEVLVPLAVAFALAYVVTPVVDQITRLGVNRLVAAGMLFGLGSLVLIIALVLVVPAVVRQTVDLSVQVFQGESYVDRNKNGRYDAGEPFDDANHNNHRDPALLTRLATFLEESQDRLRVNFGLGLGEQSLAFLTVYERDTHALHAWLDEMIMAAQQGRAAAEWPLPPVSLSELSTVETDWNPAWPGPQVRDVVDAETYIPAADQSAWRELMTRGGLTLFRKHAAWIAALRQAKDNDKNASSPLVGEIQRAWRSTLSLEERKQALIFALALESQAKAGQNAAHELLGVAGVSADSPISGETLSDVVAKVEDTVRGSVDDLPTRLGGWAKAGLSSYDAVLSLAINLMLIPIYSFFLLLGMPRIRTFIKHFLPAIHKQQIVRITREIEKVVAAFFRGRLLICTICSVVGCLGFLIIGWFGVHVPYGMLWGIGIGMATAIPLAGLLFIIPAVALTLMAPNAGLMDLVAVVAVYGVVQGLEACLISVIMGREVELHPVTLIVALLLCSKLLGILGLILAVPIAASFRILLREYFWPRMEAWATHGSWALPAPTSDLPAVPAEHPRNDNSA